MSDALKNIHAVALAKLKRRKDKKRIHLCTLQAIPELVKVAEILWSQKPRCPPHHWDCAPPRGPTSKAVCKRCGATNEFENWGYPKEKEGIVL